MSYIVLARKYRPQKFADVIGQEHITEILGSAITSNRIAHAYLFCGPRGVGKTSCARIFAKSLNCQEGPTLEPCNQCPSCREITQANSFDVIEIDGASNRGIDEIRTLRENVKFAPSYGRYKIYIVDEVHMLTMEAFNALLKTLEEPPEHAKFIFATTSPNKVPSTIISRCQRFDFKRVAIPTIVKLLDDLAKRESVQIEQDALFAIAKAAQGSFRDALSILDQMSALSERSIEAKDVFSMLGLVETEWLFELVDCLARKDCAAALTVFEKIIDQGKDVKQLSRDVTEHFRHLMVMKVGGKTLGKLVDYPISTKEALLTQSEKFSLSEILNAIAMLIEAQDMARVMESLRMPLEIAFAKLTYTSQKKGVGTETAAPKSAQTSAASWPQAPVTKAPLTPAPKPIGAQPSMIRNEKGEVDLALESTYRPEPSAGQEILLEQEPGEPLDLERIKRGWSALTHAVSRETMSVATYLQEGSPVQFNGTTLTVGFPKDAVFQKESLEETATLRLIERVFYEKLKTRISVQMKFLAGAAAAAPPGQEHGPIVKSALETFKGKIVNKWHNE